jgi:hypothetical protein
MAWASQAAQSDEGRARLDLARRMDGVVGATDATLEILQAAARGAIRGLQAEIPSDKRIPLDSFRAEIAKLGAELRAETVASMAFTYREASLAETTRYAQSFESEIARWFSALQRDAAVQAAEATADAAMRRIVTARRLPRAEAPLYRRVGIDRGSAVDDGESRCSPICSSPSPCSRSSWARTWPSSTRASASTVRAPRASNPSSPRASR